MCTLEQHVDKCHTASSTISPSAFVKNLKQIGKSLRLGRQEDAHEFLRYLVEQVQQKAKHNKSDSKILDNIFNGSLESQISCSGCKSVYKKIDPMSDLSLEVYNSTSVESALEKFSCVETLKGDNRYKCER